MICCQGILLNVSCGSGSLFEPDKRNALRAPSYPLISVDPYTSVWSFADELNADVTRHWTGKEQALLGVVDVDGVSYRFMGKETPEEGASVRFATAARQLSVNVLPTQTYYTFECGPVLLDVVFTAPLLLDDLDRMSMPVNYISWQVRSADQKKHEVRVSVEAFSSLAVNTEDQAVMVEREVENGISYLKTGTAEQAVLLRKGDDVRIDWGYFYLAAQVEKETVMEVGDRKQLVYSHILEAVSSSPKAGFLMVGYDDLYAIQYFKDNRMAYWKHNGKKNIRQAFEESAKEYRSVMERCRHFDTRLMEDAEKAGGKEYAELCAIAYRQAVAAHKLIEDKDGNLLFLSKENFSNGSIGTVDVTYPSAPLFLLYNPELLKGMLNPIFHYSESGRWNKPFAAHDVGTYPHANGQTYPFDMPVEECGNMLILTTAIALREGNADYAREHWKTLGVWANYLLKEGLDPENQLCTDDFAGHLAHNANLSIKAIIGIAGYGKLAEMLGDKEQAVRYVSAAREMAEKWERMADDGDHYRLTFDRENTWSQKYNLVWDRVLGLHIFPDRIARKEVAFYLSRQQPFGLPLDSRKNESSLEIKEESIRAKNELDKEIKERRAEIQRNERRIEQKEANIDRKLEAVEKREAGFAAKEEEINREKEEVARLHEERVQELERISGLTSEQAKEYLLKTIEDDVKIDTAKLIKEMESKAKEEAGKKAKEYVVTAIQKCAADHVAETTISVVQLPTMR